MIDATKQVRESKSLVTYLIECQDETGCKCLIAPYCDFRLESSSKMV